MSTVLTVGTFDLFHVGHVKLLEFCRSVASASGGQVIVGVNTYRFAGTFKKPPVISLDERMTVLGACRYVDAVVVNDNASLQPLMEIVRPRYLVIGADWAPPRDYMAQIGSSAEWLNSHCIKLMYVPREATEQSSTAIREAVIREQRIYQDDREVERG